jgi:hypothetical protein
MPRFGCGYPHFFDYNECMISKTDAHLRECFRRLWEQHVYWTRMVIMSIALNLPDLEANTTRLLRNAPDFEKLLCRFYGAENAAEFTPLLTNHLTIAAELVTETKANNMSGAADAEKKWYANANNIVCFLSRINPCWSVKQMRKMWYEHLALTKKEAVAILNKDYTKSIEIFNQIEREALMMADNFSQGIIN